MLTELPRPLFILELANNHMGDVEHGIRIIRECSEALEGVPYRCAIKLQYRSLDTFIHPDYQDRYDLKYVKRFQETRLSEKELLRLRRAIEDYGFLAACTPFDEASVDLFEMHRFDILKIASCSLTDWPLLERCVATSTPIVASTAGTALPEIDKVVSFFGHRGRTLALMHCVAEYPTASHDLRLGQIDVLRARYPDLAVGFSTHELPSALEPVQLAVAKGASIFEKHVGIPRDDAPLNEYSATPTQVRRWIEAADYAQKMCGAIGTREVGSEREVASLRALRRGAYSRADVKKGQPVLSSDVFFAMPVQNDHLTAQDFSKYAELVAVRDIAAKEALTVDNICLVNHRDQVYEIARSVKELLAKSGVVVPRRADLEISHHYGFERFNEVGLTMITVVNREYCKKLIVMLPGQSHPEQYHKVKEETFHLLYGDLSVSLDGAEQQCRAGDVVTVERNVKHAFKTMTGAVIEEVSSSHLSSDSYYSDPMIGRNQNRKTLLTYWLDGTFS